MGTIQSTVAWLQVTPATFNQMISSDYSTASFDSENGDFTGFVEIASTEENNLSK